MSFNQTRDLLDHARDFHRRLGRFYEELHENAPAGQTRKLLENLTEHEQGLGQRLKEYEEGVSGNILDTFFKYMLNGVEDYFAQYHVPDVIETGDVVAAARYFNDHLESFYKEMAGKAQSEHVREVLLNLMKMEQQEQLSLSKQMLELSA